MRRVNNKSQSYNILLQTIICMRVMMIKRGYDENINNEKQNHQYIFKFTKYLFTPSITIII